MDDKLMKMEELACNLSTAVAEKYDLSARDAVGVVLQSKIANHFLSADDQLLSTPIDELVAAI